MLVTALTLLVCQYFSNTYEALCFGIYNSNQAHEMLSKPIQFGSDNMMGMILMSRAEAFHICFQNDPNNCDLEKLSSLFRPGMALEYVDESILKTLDDIIIGGLR